MEGFALDCHTAGTMEVDDSALKACRSCPKKMQLTNLYQDYKPLRNYMRRFDLVQGLIDIWRLSLHVTECLPLPLYYPAGMPTVSLKQKLYPWHLDIFARELVIHAGNGGARSLSRWHDLAVAINHVRDLEGAVYSFRHTRREDAFVELHRYAHQQFAWRPLHGGVNPMTRYLKVFGQVAVQEVIMRELGMTMAQFVQLGLAVVGHFFGQEVMSVDQDYRALGISRDSSLAFFRRITSTITELRNKTKDQQSYDGDWLFAWNPLESKPLIAFDPSFPDRVLCPIPSYLIRRTQGGIFFDLINASGFDNSFGESFQAYVGEVIKLVCRPPQFTALAEEEFHVGKKRMDGVDWILADNTAHLFIECKTKRLKLAAKIRADTVALEEALATMATAIVQNYKNILLALNGKTKWIVPLKFCK